MKNLAGFKIPVHEISYFDETSKTATFSLGEYDVRTDTYIVTSWHHQENGNVLRSKIRATLPQEILGDDLKPGVPFPFRMPILDKQGIFRKQKGTITLIAEGPTVYVVRVGKRTAVARRVGNAHPAVIIGVGLIALGAIGVIAGAVVAIEGMEEGYDVDATVGVDTDDGEFGFTLEVTKDGEDDFMGPPPKDEKKKNEEDTSGGGG